MFGRGRGRGREMGGQGPLPWLPGPPSSFLGRGAQARPSGPPTVLIPPTPLMTEMNRNREETAWMGMVTMINPGKKFGFLKTDNPLPRGYTGDSLFFHFDIVKNFLGKTSALTQGSKVKFILYKAKDGDRATLEKPKAFAVYLIQQPTANHGPVERISGSRPGSNSGDRTTLTEADARDAGESQFSPSCRARPPWRPWQPSSGSVPLLERSSSTGTGDAKERKDSKAEEPKTERPKKEKAKSGVSTGKDIKSKLASGNKHMKVCLIDHTHVCKV